MSNAYSPVSVIKQYVKSDGVKCLNIDEIYSHLSSRTYRPTFEIDGTNLSNSNKIIDIVAIGLENNRVVGTSTYYSPVVISLDVLPFMNLKLGADKTFPDTNNNYFSDHQPLYLNNTNTALTLPGVKIKLNDLASCNKYLVNTRTVPYCGARTSINVPSSANNVNYWTGIENNFSNLSKNNNMTTVMELNLLFYTTELIDQLQTRLGYRIPNSTDPYHWSNWLVANTNGTGGSGSIYYKLLYLTEFDFYMHNGAMSNISKIDSYLANSFDFSNLMDQIITTTNTNTQLYTNNVYHCSNVLNKGSILHTGQFIYSKDYKFKLQLNHNGHLRVYKFPVFNDNMFDASVCSNVLLATSWSVIPDMLASCYLFLQNDGNITINQNVGTSMATDPNYLNVINAFTPNPPSLNTEKNTAIVIVSNFMKANNISWNAVGYSDLQLYKILITRNTSNAIALINFYNSPTTLTTSTSMSKNSNYTNVINSYSTTFLRDNAISIVNEFMTINNILGNSNVLNNFQLYTILTITNFHYAISLLNLYVNNTIISQDKLFNTNKTLASSNTGGDAYFAMSDYKVILNFGGSVVAVNAGHSSIASDQVAMIEGSNSMNKYNTTNSNDLMCIHGWKYINKDGTNVFNGNQNNLLQSATGSWCYQNPFLVYTSSDGFSYKFGATNMQLILWYISTFNSTEIASSIDNIYNFFNSGVIEKAKSLGYKGSLTLDVNKQLITVNYCMRGDRWSSNNECTNISTNTSLLPSPLQKLIDYDIKSRICSTPSSNSLCLMVNPSVLSSIENSLFMIDKNFVYASNVAIGALTQYSNYTTTPTGTLSINIGKIYQTITDIECSTKILNTIQSNSTKLNEIQLLYLSKFFSTNDPTLINSVYTSTNLFMYQNMYSAKSIVVRNSPNNQYKLILQNDGNLVIQDNSSNIIWNSNTSGNPDAVLVIETNSNVSLYSNTTFSKVLWTTNTSSSNKNPVMLSVDNNGILVLFNFINNGWYPLWTNNNVQTYSNNPVIITTIPKLYDQSILKNIYKANFLPSNATLITAINNTIDPIKYPYSLVVYKNNYDKIIGWIPTINTTDLISKGGAITNRPYTYLPTDNIWKYIRYFIDISLPYELKPLTVSEITSTITSIDPKILTSTQSPYKQEILYMTNGSTTGPIVGNVIIFTLKDVPSIINYMRSTGLTLDQDEFKKLCKTNLDACYAEFSSLVSKPQTDLQSSDFNTICDIAVLKNASSTIKNINSNYSTIISSYTPTNGFGTNRSNALTMLSNYLISNKLTGDVSKLTDLQLYKVLIGEESPVGIFNGYSGTFSNDNSNTIKSLCNTTYGTQKCLDPLLRYKSSFTNKEKFSGIDCITACNDTSASDSIKNSCKIGSISYCKESDNIFNKSCTDDISKYSELSEIKSKWCDNNKTHTNYNTHCSTTNNISNDNENQDYTTIIIIVISICLLILLGVFIRYKFKKNKNIDYETNPSNLSYDSYMTNLNYETTITPSYDTNSSNLSYESSIPTTSYDTTSSNISNSYDTNLSNITTSSYESSIPTTSYDTNSSNLSYESVKSDTKI